MAFRTRMLTRNGEYTSVESEARYTRLKGEGWQDVTAPLSGQPFDPGAVNRPSLDQHYATQEQLSGVYAQRYKSSRYYYVSSPGANTGGTQNNQQMKAVPWPVAERIVIDRLFVDISTAGNAGSLVRLGVYSDDGTGEPGALLVNAGTIDASTTGVKEITLASPFTLEPGLYWATAGISGATTTVPVLRGVNASQVLHPGSPTLPGTNGSFVAVVGTLTAEGTFPQNWAVSGSPSGNGPRIGFRVT